MKKLALLLIAAVLLMSCTKEALVQPATDAYSVQKTQAVQSSPDLTQGAQAYTLELFHTYTFTEGWHSISFYLQGESDAIAEVLAPIDGKFDIVKNLTQVYWPGYGNTIGDIDYSEGYIIHITQACELTVMGEVVTGVVQVIPEGWSIQGVPYAEPQPVEELFPIEPLEHNIVKEAITGKIYWPYMNINQIGNCLPGSAYKVHID